jgi:hypothetical protein
MKITKKEYSDFLNDVLEIIKKHHPSFRKISSPIWVGYEIETKIGKLLINLCIEDDSDIYSIFCRFDEVEKYSKFESNRVNKYSGKWNFHHESKGVILSFFENELKEIVCDTSVENIE